MATVTKTIGATGRDYSTIVLWEADLDDADDYNADDDAVGECYDDADFDMNGDFTLDGGDLDDGSGDLATVRLTVAEGHRHDGTKCRQIASHRGGCFKNNTYPATTGIKSGSLDASRRP